MSNVETLRCRRCNAALEKKRRLSDKPLAPESRWFYCPNHGNLLRTEMFWDMDWTEEFDQEAVDAVG